MRTIRFLAVAALVCGTFLLASDPTTASDEAATKAALKKAKQEMRKKARALAEAAPAPAVQAVVAVPAARTAAAPRHAAETARLIDEQVDRKLAEAKVPASPAATDGEFLRRAFLDVTGTIPSAERARAFLDDRDADKRAKLIDELLASPHYGRHMADIWQAKLYPTDSNNRFLVKEPFVKWLADEFNANAPWDLFAGKLLAGTGTVEENPAVTFTLANRAADKLTDHVGNHFLGIQLQCAQCHNHPFVKDWKQTDYWGVASFFSKVNADRPKNANKGGDNAKIGVVEGSARTKGKDFFPEATKVVAPKFFMAEEPKLSSAEPYRPALVRWLTAPDNPYFARAIVNRTWAQLFGPGFVNPIEDMHDDNPASHPELLAALAHDFGRAGYDLKHLIRGICNSRAYQRSSRPAAGSHGAEEGSLFAHQTVKVMSPEQLYDSLSAVGAGEKEGSLKGKAAGGKKGGPATPRDRFVHFFLAGAEQPNANEYEAGIPQALRLMNSKNALGGVGALRSYVQADRSPTQVVERIYLSALSRRPTLDETRRLGQYLSANGNSGESYSDILWAVLNSSEFAMVR